MTFDRAVRTIVARPVPAAVSLLAVALLIRAYDFGNPIVHVDEEWYLLVGDRLLQGARLYLDVWDRKPLGLFAIFAAIRLLPGDGVWAYQLCATAFAAGTAWLIRHAARLAGAPARGAWVAGAVYILWLSLLSGRGGQAPVFYNLFMAGAACLTLRLPMLADRVSAIVVNGAAACALAGLAIQTKYTPAIEGAFFGCAHLWFLHRARARVSTLAIAATLWAALGLLPTALAALYFAAQGPEAWAAFWFANFTSITLRHGYPAAKIAARLAGTGAQLLPLLACALLRWREQKGAMRALLFGWLAAALVAFAMIGAFFDHYALPLLLPLAVIAARPLDRPRLAAGVAVYGLLLLGFHLIEKPSRDGPGVRRVAAAMAAGSGGRCSYVFAGDAVLYLLAHACLPTRYAFPSSLAYEPERGAIGVDEAAEVRRIMAARPPMVVTLAKPLAPWNAGSMAVMAPALRDHYRLVLRVPRQEGGALLLYRRHDDAGTRAPGRGL